MRTPTPARELDRQQEEPEATGASDLAGRICEGLDDVLARTGSDPQARDACEAILARRCALPVEAPIRRKIGTSWNVQRCKQEALAALARAEAALGPQPRPTPALLPCSPPGWPRGRWRQPSSIARRLLEPASDVGKVLEPEQEESSQPRRMRGHFGRHDDSYQKGASE